MKYLLPIVLLLPTPIFAQQVNRFSVCTENREVYEPGGYDKYGNYVPGKIGIQTYNVPCGNTSPSQYNRSNSCNPTKGLLGALLGGGIAASMSRGDGYKWSVPVGAAVGGAMIGCSN
jgi:hypothetical protein